MPHDSQSLPAILGGSPVRPQGPPDWPPPDPAIADVLRQMLADGSWGRYHGPHLPNLIEQLSRLHGCEFAIPCCSGTAAVELALRAIPVRPGDEVVLAGYDFRGNLQDVLAVGGIPVLVDIRPDNWNLDTAALPAAIGPQTKAILVSHLHGGVVNMPAVRQIADERGIAVIEDACQMPGAWVYGRRAGTWGDLGVLSFGGSKLLSAGRGGAVLTSQPAMAQRIRLWTQRGNDTYPLSELQAAVLVPQITSLDQRNHQRAVAIDWLRPQLRNLGLTPFAVGDPDSQPGYYKLGLQYPPEAFAGLSRDRFAEAVRAEGIAIDPGFRALHRSHAASRFRVSGHLEEATRADAGILTLHHPVLLGTAEDWGEIITAIEKIGRHASALQ